MHFRHIPPVIFLLPFLLSHCSLEKKQIIATLVVQNDTPFGREEQAVSLGLPLAQGRIKDVRTLELFTDQRQPVPFQLDPLARWPDSSLQSLRVTFPAAALKGGWRCWILAAGEFPRAVPPPDWIKTGPDSAGFQLPAAYLSCRWGDRPGLEWQGPDKKLSLSISGAAFHPDREISGSLRCDLRDTSAAGWQQWTFFKSEHRFTYACSLASPPRWTLTLWRLDNFALYRCPEKIGILTGDGGVTFYSDALLLVSRQGSRVEIQLPARVNLSVMVHPQFLNQEDWQRRTDRLQRPLYFTCPPDYYRALGRLGPDPTAAPEDPLKKFMLSGQRKDLDQARAAWLAAGRPDTSLAALFFREP